MARAKPQVTNSNGGNGAVETIHSFLVLDETGSMASVKDETVNGVNTYIDGLKKDALDNKRSYKFSMLRFDSQKLQQDYDDVDIDRVGALTDYHPGALTPLFDAIAHSVRAMEAKLAGQAAKVIMIVMTDGAENASREIRGITEIRELIKRKETEGWTFVYLGTNEAAWGQEQAFAAGTVMAQNTRYSKGGKGMTATMHSVVDITTRYAAQANLGQTWVDPQTAADQDEINRQQGTAASKPIRPAPTTGTAVRGPSNPAPVTGTRRTNAWGE